ncbi:D-alanyl-D-alanine carboxypeptidase family protein [Desulfolucanica intricata]|uniref:D-alanyl-D-alanine carboxypeptidase family protein n=1 Tax=Desulfolucanica intricata TaxID=1285191 RepID=UPI00082B97E8|nr:D-alanyl-D-alanine carboxypeptidase family protein [Desulfolucanica intricata]
MIVKKSLTIFLTAAFLLAFAYPLAAGAEEPEISADAAVLMDSATGEVYFAKNPHQRRYPASLTKIMTAIIALENGRLNEVVTVGQKAASVSVGSIIDLRVGDKLTLENLLKAALICSANDSTVAIAEHIGGNHDNFVELMNAKALSLGATNTRFQNTNGYTLPNHYTTAYDLALITRYALKNKDFNRFIATKEDTIYWKGKERELDVRNTNRLLRESYPGIDGVKTGSTPRAGNCLIASATRDGRRLIAVVLHCRNRFTDAAKILEYGFKEIKTVQLCKQGEQLTVIPVNEGIVSEIPLVAKNSLKVDVIKEKIPLISKRLIIEDYVQAPVNKGQKLGEVVYYLDNKEICRSILVSGQDVKRKAWLKRMLEKLLR